MFGKIFKFAEDNNCSDIHINVGNEPIARQSGELKKIPETKPLTSNEVEAFIKKILNDQQYKQFQENKEIDFSFTLGDNYRYRVNVFKNSNGGAVALRPIKNKPKSLDEINAPEVIKELLQKRQGLIVVSGPTGCGKSTTLAAMIDYINENSAANIITIEDPIEYIHNSKKSLIHQREIGAHSNSFSNALRSSLRQDPDILLVGEMRDLETISLALTAAETGHLVLTTLHTSSASNAISRIIDVFQHSEQQIVRTMLGNSLNGVILQHLLPTKEDKMAAAFEILIANPSIKNLIREDKLPQVNSMMEIGKKHGMITFKESVTNMLNQGVIDQKVAEEFLKKF